MNERNLLFRRNCCPAERENNLKADIYLIELSAPVEEFLTIAINDTANTLFIAGIAGLLCHATIFFFSLI